MIELERTYLAKELPQGLGDMHHKEILDVYIPASDPHPSLRLRKNGDVLELTKKTPVKEGDASHQLEQTISVSEAEFQALLAVPGKRVRKMRYYFPYQGRTAEIDVFQDDLAGLILVDFEFESMEDMNAFAMPSFCLIEVTQETFIAGGMLCGKHYEDIQDQLEAFQYQPLLLNE